MDSFAVKGVCATQIQIDVSDNKINKVKFLGGCSGNSQGVAKLVEGMSISDAVNRLKGIRCGGRPTSCPDQLAKALESYL